MFDLTRVGEVEWEIALDGKGRVARAPARIFADQEILDAVAEDRSLEQLVNVASLPGVVSSVIAMPDIHQGYGFPVGGVAATDAKIGVVSPGGVGYDINCGVRMLVLPASIDEIGSKLEALVGQISRSAPSGAGKDGPIALGRTGLDDLLIRGPQALVERGIGQTEDVSFTESQGRLPAADPAAVSERAKQRGVGQVGTIGSGNHFIEVQEVTSIEDEAAASVFGLKQGSAAVLIHSGSRGLGHQVCSDYVRTMDQLQSEFAFDLPDRQLACAPLSSESGQRYIAAMAAAANFAWGNRHALGHAVRSSIRSVLGNDIADKTRTIYDVAHNVAKMEIHAGKSVCVHRKGATRAFPPGHPEIPPDYAAVGQPVFIPGSMGTASWVLAGTEGAMQRSFGTVCHGAGRRLSRTAVKKQVNPVELRKQLASKGIVVRAASKRGLVEEAPIAYKDVDRVVSIVERAGLARRVARVEPRGVVKG